MEDKFYILDKFVDEMSEVLTMEQAVVSVRRRWIMRELKAHRWNQCHAAKALGWHRNTLARNMAQLGIHPQKRYQANPRSEPTRVVMGV